MVTIGVFGYKLVILELAFVDHADNGEHYEVNENEESTSETFATLQAKLFRGRSFIDSEDGTKPKVAVINNALAKKYFPLKIQ